jgi:type II secretory pathway pseudopilin PulG
MIFLEMIFGLLISKGEKSGFSLMETVVSIGIITVGIVSILSLFAYNMENEIRSKNKLIAVYLAQEQIEIIRQIRDNNWFAGRSWTSGIPEGEVIISLNNQNDVRKGWKVVSISGDGYKGVYDDNNLYIQHDSNLSSTYNYTGFDRWATISLEYGSDPDASSYFEVVSHVSHSGIQDVEMTTRLYKWQWR